MADVTRQLVIALRAQGHSCVMASLYDPFLAGDEIKITKEECGAPLLRLGREIQAGQFKRELDKMIHEFQPDWISLQFVCYGFHPKGFVFGWGERLAAIAPRVPWQIMFHEVWLGERRDASFKEKCIGKIQKFFVRGLLKSIRPRVVHTSNQTYREILRSLDLNPQVLSLIGGVKIPDSIDEKWGENLLRDSLGLKEGFRRREWWWTGIYGALHSNWPPEPLLPEIRHIAQKQGKKVAFFHLGRSRGGEGLLTQMKEKYCGDDFQIVALGEKPEEEISSILRSFDFGIAATPWQIIGKSSTVATLLELGIPTVVNREEEYQVPEGSSEDELLIRMSSDFKNELPCRLAKRIPVSRGFRIAHQMIQDLSK